MLQSFEELEIGAKNAWKNSNRCIGRAHWNSLEVIDARHVKTTKQMFEALLHHIEYATNDGNIRSVVTIFPESEGDKQFRVWNHQLVRYAGYEMTGNKVLGDPHSLEFTKVVNFLGWRKKYRSHFDVLPLVLETPSEGPAIFEIPENYIKEIPIIHPHFKWFQKLGLKWYATPIISDMALATDEAHTYSAAPFNGYYMGTEVAARNLADKDRYDVLPALANRLGLDMNHESTLWKDKAMIELNLAVLYSYKKAGVKMIDHHTASKQHQAFEESMCKHGEQVTGDWSWLVPPISGSLTPQFHKEYDNEVKLPNFIYQKAAWKENKVIKTASRLS